MFVNTEAEIAEEGTLKGLAAGEARRTLVALPQPGDALLFRRVVIGLLAVGVLAPVGLIVYQSFLDGPFFQPTTALSLDAYRYILSDPMFYDAFLNTVIMAVGMVAIALPLGAALAFLLTRART
jgi:iron(III) transport system permease protein